MTRLEYLMVYTESGLPIYSKCYGHFCKAAFKNPELLSGFLSAIETIPPTLSEGLRLESVRMGDTEMRFSKTTPQGHSIVIGLSEDDSTLAEKVFEEVQSVLMQEKYRERDWSHISSDIMNEFKNDLLTTALPSALHDHDGFEDQCPLGDKCPMASLANESKNRSVWSVIKKKYQSMKERVLGKS
ncbi:MAG: hypothetical protein BAJATHORv1_30421 [Candidatus Thorarchaeota archaeon]|nr:MAG: hypothetical protein BAJATHORv1_30421 [Candidatus Thorarchaeota archaeon]